MSKPSDPTGFGQFVPGFDFLQKLAQGGKAPMAGWVAPTLDPEALDKRISELQTVQFWLDQNAAALKATIQALEVQKMTLATLKSMNVPMPGAAPAAQAAAAPQAKTPTAAPTEKVAASATPMADSMQYWSALTQQFQQIAGQAMQDAAARGAAAAQAAPAPAAKAAKKAAPRKPKPA